MPISHKYKLIYVHIPKCGGSSVASSFGIKINNNILQKNFLFGLYNGKALQHLSKNEIDLFTRNEYWDYFSFSFVRNPFDKIVSEYAWFIKHNFINKNIITFKKFLKIHLIKNSKVDNIYADHFYCQAILY